jgi:hypothetical protein
VSHFEQSSRPRPLELRQDGSKIHSSMAAFLAFTLATIVMSIILLGTIAFLPSGLH